MATAASTRNIKEIVFEWEGRDRNGKAVRGEMRAAGENQVQASLRRQGVLASKIKKRRMRGGKSIKPKDIAIFTRQLAVMMKAGVPLLQSFDIVGRGNANASVTKLLNDIRLDVETGTKRHRKRRVAGVRTGEIVVAEFRLVTIDAEQRVRKRNEWR